MENRIDLSEANVIRGQFRNVLSDFEESLNVLEVPGSVRESEFSDLLNLVHDIKMNISGLKRSVEEPFKVAVMGAQGTGKSTVINLLIEEDLMPQSLYENEAAIVKTVYTDDPEMNRKAKICFLPDENGQKHDEILTYNEFLNLIDLHKSKALIENERYKDKVELFELYSDNKNLMDVQMINTPGMNVLTSDFYSKIRHLFKEADLIIWVFSKNNLVDKFNKERINEIHNDNKNIIGILSNSDKLFKQDTMSGVKDVVSQFLDEVESGILKRVKREDRELICLFPYNGKAALKANNMDTSVVINDLDDIQSEEEKELLMLWNYFSFGYPYATYGDDFRFEMSMFTPSDDIPTKSKNTSCEFNVKDFLNDLLTDKLLKQVEDNTSRIIYTDKGKELLLRCSQLSSIEEFANNHIFSVSLIEKLHLIKERFEMIYTEKNKLYELEMLKKEYKNQLSSLDSAFKSESDNLDRTLENLTTRYNEWRDDRLSKLTKSWSGKLVDEILSRIDNDISKSDMAKEIWAMVKGKFAGEREGPAMKKIEKICEESTMQMIESSLNDLIKESLDEIQNTLTELGYDTPISEPRTPNPEINSPPVDIKPPVPKIDYKKILVKLKPLLTEMLIKIARMDLRKRMPKIAKQMIKYLRTILVKLGVKWAKKKTAESALKAFAGPGGWLLLALDVFSTGKEISDMLKDMKSQIKEEMEQNKSEFADSLREILFNVFSNIIDETKKNIRDNLKPDDIKTARLQTAIDFVQGHIEVFYRYQYSLKGGII